MATKDKLPSELRSGNGEDAQAFVDAVRALSAADNTTTTDLELAAAVVALVVTACESGDREILDRLADARAVLTDTRTMRDRERGYLQLVDGLTRAERTQEWQTAEAKPLSSSMPLAKMLAFYDPAFAKLDDGQVFRVLNRAVSDGVGGRGRAGYLQVAAELAVEAGAFRLGVRVDATAKDALSHAVEELKAARG